MLYGPPAAGKLTVARGLEAAHGLRVLDNHLTVDAALRLFDYGTRPFAELVKELRTSFFRAAAVARLDVVSTFVYAHPVDGPLVEDLCAATTGSGGTMAFVQLAPPADVLRQRVVRESRAVTKKIRDVARLDAMLDGADLYTPIHDHDLRIDNADLSSDDAVALIAERLGLTRQAEDG